MSSTSVAVPVLVVNTLLDLAMVMDSVLKGFTNPAVVASFTRFDLAKKLLPHIDQTNEIDMHLINALVNRPCRVRLPK